MPTVNVHLSDEEHRDVKTQAATYGLTLSELMRRNWLFATWVGEQRVHAVIQDREGEPLTIGDAMIINFTKSATIRKRLASIDSLGHHVRSLESLATEAAEMEGEDEIADVRKRARKLAKYIPWKPMTVLSTATVAAVFLLSFMGVFCVFMALGLPCPPWYDQAPMVGQVDVVKNVVWGGAEEVMT